jgi:hypothetical protein
MTKIEALLRRLLLMRSQDPTAKALVFSQYQDALALISKALNVVQVCVCVDKWYFACMCVCVVNLNPQP